MVHSPTIDNTHRYRIPLGVTKLHCQASQDLLERRQVVPWGLVSPCLMLMLVVGRLKRHGAREPIAGVHDLVVVVNTGYAVRVSKTRHDAPLRENAPMQRHASTMGAPDALGMMSLHATTTGHQRP